jgi:hypothetical protein
MEPGLKGTSVTRHDLSLLVIAGSLLMGVLVGTFFSVGLLTALLAASVLATACMSYVLFYSPPVNYW